MRLDAMTTRQPQFWRPEAVSAGGERLREEAVAVNQRLRHLPLQQQRDLLPISRLRRELLFAVERHPVVVLVGETGSGKSTQVPLFLHEAGWLSRGRGAIVSQPRRIAAQTLATRVAAEMGVELGGEVGYAVRFDSRISPRTVIRYVTDGLLLRYFLADPLLSEYAVVMVDEAHERSLHSDVVLGLLKKVLRKRSDLRVIVTSATINAVTMKGFFDDALRNRSKHESCVVSIEGRTHPVDVLYLREPTANYVKEVMTTVLKIHRSEGRGDVLAFLPGAEEIDAAQAMLREAHDGNDLLLLPLHGSLPTSSQMLAFQPAEKGCRK